MERFKPGARGKCVIEVNPFLHVLSRENASSLVSTYFPCAISFPFEDAMVPKNFVFRPVVFKSSALVAVWFAEHVVFLESFKFVEYPACPVLCFWVVG